MASFAPTATGGTIVDGTYNQTQDIMYTGPGGATGPAGTVTLQSTITFASGTLTSVTVGNACNTEDFVWSYSTQGNQLLLSETCPSNWNGCYGPPWTYSVTTNPYTIILCPPAKDPTQAECGTYQ